MKCKNQEGYELLDFFCPGDPQEDKYLNLFDNLFNSQINVKKESDWNLSESDSSSNEKFYDAFTTL